MSRIKTPHKSTIQPTTHAKQSAIEMWQRKIPFQRIELDAAHLDSDFLKHVLVITKNETSQALVE